MNGAEKRRARASLGLPKYFPGEMEARKKRRNAMRGLCVALAAAIKIERGCADCGYRAHAIALDFDHLPGSKKIAGVAALANASKTKRMLLEIEKCEVVCANCHRVRSLSRGDYGGKRPAR